MPSLPLLTVLCALAAGLLLGWRCARLAARPSTSARISTHDLNNLLLPIRAYAQLVDRDVEAGTDPSADVRELLDAVGRLTDAARGSARPEPRRGSTLVPDA